MLDLSTIIDDSQEDINATLKRAGEASSDGIALSLLLKGLSDVRDAVSGAAINHVSVDNLDEVKASLHNELSRISKPIIKAIDKLALDRDRIEAIKNEIEAKNREALNETHDIQIVKKPKQRLEIANIGDIAFPSSVKINNLDDLKIFFDSLSDVITNKLNLDIPAPQVTVSPPEVNIPEIKIPESSINIDVDGLLSALEPLKFLSDRPNKALSVRLSDGNKFVKALRTIVENQERQATAFSQGLNESSARKAFKQAIDSNKGSSVTEGRKALSDSSAGVQVTSTSTPIKYVYISADTAGDVVAVGGSTSTQLDSATGMILTPGTPPVRLDITDLNKLYASGATGSALCYTYFS